MGKHPKIHNFTTFTCILATNLMSKTHKKQSISTSPASTGYFHLSDIFYYIQAFITEGFSGMLLSPYHV